MSTISQALTPAQFAAVKAELASEGLPLSADHGIVTHSGVTAAYSYDGTTITIDLQKTPPFLGAHIAKLIAEKLAEAAR